MRARMIPPARRPKGDNQVKAKGSRLNAPDTVTTRPHEVEFRFISSRGVRSVRIFLYGEPRFVCASYSGVRVSPMSMTVRELLELVEEARSILEPDRFGPSQKG